MTYTNKVVSGSDGFEVNVPTAFAVVRVGVSVSRVGFGVDASSIDLIGQLNG